ncbi:MAG: sugar ABC transporter permease [Firmicutes bacterium]|nr:sugar ABC transporter permease [Bacillota bacterium]
MAARDTFLGTDQTRKPRLLFWELPNRYSKFGMLIILPTIIYFLVFRIGPIIYSLIASFSDWNLVEKMRFIGGANYIRAVTDKVFLASLQRSLTYSIVVVTCTLTISIVLAVLFDQTLSFRNWYRAAYFLPTVISWVVISIIWKTMYNPSFGLVSYIADLLHITPIPILTSTQRALPGIMVIGIWQAIGFYMVIFLAALQAIDPNLYEAAVIDGASPVKTFWNITLPLLRPTLLFAIVMSTIETLQVFAQVYVMTRGGPANSTLVAVYYIYRTAFYLQDMGYASALAIILLIVIMCLSLLYLKFFKTETYYSR